MATLTKVADRAKLKPRRDPYYVTLARGCSLGYRKMTAGGDGTWIARFRDSATSKQNYRPLGALDELPPNERYDAAKRAAEEWFKHLGHGGSAEKVTVREACERYAAYLAREKGNKAAAEATRRFRQYVFDHPIAKIDLAKLAAHHVKTWRESLQDLPTVRGKPRSRATINRDLVAVRAALNHAKADGLVTTDAAWAEKLKPLEDAHNRRELYLDRAQRKALIDAAPDDLALFIRALCAVPLRPGAVAALRVADFDKRTNILTVRSDKAAAGRQIPLPTGVAKLFTDAMRHKLPRAHLFTRSDGEPWVKDKWTHPVRAAVAAAGLPEETTLYTLRHSGITDLVTGGADLYTVAELAGTSVDMIDKTYGKLRPEAVATALDRIAL